MDKQERYKVLSGRQAVNAYRLAHSQLYSGGWHKDIPEGHTPLFNTLLAELKKHGAGSLDEFFKSSELLNMQELGFVSREDFEAKATGIDIADFDRKWH